MAVPDSLQLRLVAEWASSVRSRSTAPEEVFFTVNPDAITGRLGAPASLPGGESIGPFTTFEVAERLRPSQVRMTVRDPFGNEMHIPLIDVTLPDGQVVSADSVFWSEAAVEKFVFPYYASKMGWHAAEYLTKLARAFYGFVPPFTITSTASLSLSTPIAVIHIPRSEYELVYEDGEVTPFLELGLVHHHPESGKLEVRLLSDYVATELAAAELAAGS